MPEGTQQIGVDAKLPMQDRAVSASLNLKGQHKADAIGQKMIGKQPKASLPGPFSQKENPLKKRTISHCPGLSDSACHFASQIANSSFKKTTLEDLVRASSGNSLISDLQTALDEMPVNAATKPFLNRLIGIMQRNINQTSQSAEELTAKIKERINQIDLLSKLKNKIIGSNGAIDWSKDEEMKKLVDEARKLGVDIPPGKYKWSEDEKKVLKEEIDRVKDSTDKFNQIDRTEMQKYLNRLSYDYQLMSSALKNHRETGRTLTNYNGR